MKIMIIGDSSSGKSTFANKLGKVLSLPVIHLDEIMDAKGRENKYDIKSFIEEEIKKESWIIDGNAFTKEKDQRIHAADIIFVFNLNPFVSLYRHIARHIKILCGKEIRIGSVSTKLNLPYFIPYILFKFPTRKREAMGLAKKLGKRVITINNTSEADSFITSKISSP